MSSAVWRAIISIGHITYSFVDRHTHTHTQIVCSAGRQQRPYGLIARAQIVKCLITISDTFDRSISEKWWRFRRVLVVCNEQTLGSASVRQNMRAFDCICMFFVDEIVANYLILINSFHFALRSYVGVRRVCIEGTNRRNMQHAHHTRTTARRHMPHNTIVRFIIIVVVVVDETIGGSNLTRVNCCITPPNISFWFDSFDFKWRNETSDVHWFVFNKPS